MPEFNGRVKLSEGEARGLHVTENLRLGRSLNPIE